MSALHETARWRETSLEARVAAWRCATCGLRPSRTDQLHAAHVVAVTELRRLGGGALARWGCAPENVAALCRTCHKSYDYLICRVRDPERLLAAVLGRLRARVRRFAEAFAELERRRGTLLARIAGAA